MVNFASAFVLNVLAYACIWGYGRIGETSHSLGAAFFSVFQWKSFLLLLVGNMFFSAALYLYFKQTAFAVPVCIAIGALTSFFLGVIVLHSPVNGFKILGILGVIFGVFLMFR